VTKKKSFEAFHTWTLQESTMAQDAVRGLRSFSLRMPEPSNAFITIDQVAML
jgi:hypothetical protein